MAVMTCVCVPLWLVRARKRCVFIVNTVTVCAPVSLLQYDYDDYETYEAPQPLNCSTTESIKGGNVTYSQVKIIQGCWFFFVNYVTAFINKIFWNKMKESKNITRQYVRNNDKIVK